MDFASFIDAELIILVAALYALGVMLKNSYLKDKYIPFALLIPSILACIAIKGLNVQAIIQGVLCTATAVYTNQLVKQSKKE
jgi:hypothetical protein